MATARRTPRPAWAALAAAVVLCAVSAYRATAQPASDVRTYRQWINGADLPSWTVPGPYPLGADLLWWPLRWVHGSSVQSNLWWLACCTLPVTLVACAVLWRTAARPVPAIAAWLLAAGLLERSYWMRMEPVAALGALLMVVGVRRGRTAWPALALSGGALVKLWPVFLAPTALVTLLGRGRRRDPAGPSPTGPARWAAPLRWTAWFALPWVGYALAVVLLHPPHATTWATFTFRRRTQVESLAALPALWGIASGSKRWTIRAVGGLDSTDIVLGPHLHGPRYALQALGLAVLVLLAVRVVRWRLAVRDAPSGPDAQVLGVVLAAQVVVLLVLIFAGPVFSPQYLVWFAAPLAVAVGEGQLGREALVWIAGCALTFWEFPVLWLNLARGEPFAIAVLTARDAVLAVLLVLCLLRVWKGTRRRPAPTTTGRPVVDVAAAGRDGARRGH